MRVTERVQEQLALYEIVLEANHAAIERVQALASATAAIESAPASVDMAMSFFMVAVSLMNEGCRCGSRARRLRASCQPDIAAAKHPISFCRRSVTVCNKAARALACGAALTTMRP